MKIRLIPERCIACGLCQTYSELFDYHDNGIVRFFDDPEQLEKEIPCSDDALEAVKNCPTRALIIDES
ncbi:MULTISPECIES: ferredoxin [unclassified Streptococcus]|uniref:ferredoxin n=1 Tax=Streptococcus TaxID=1301 RepID=UPI000A579C19|nr:MULTISPECIES: ferredoxin [unclassified Streptococcus]MCP9015822.1 ferredoxin [Streptococcus sp. CF8_St5-17]QLF55240.1 ferredoxin [Streptococcus sp. oral taxon 061]QLF55265.1 ferredoxin [Streptococcus sp. oral taxon 061]